jgi:hypothetical protein
MKNFFKLDALGRKRHSLGRRQNNSLNMFFLRKKGLSSFDE